MTCDATGPAGEVHDRTPVILPRDRVDTWLDPALTDPAKVTQILAGIQPPLLSLRAVSRDVNKASVDRPDLINPIEHEEQQLQLVAA